MKEGHPCSVGLIADLMRELELRTEQGWLYLATVINLATR